MPVLDFVREERPVRVAGRSYRVGPPTVGTVLLALGLLADRALAVAQALADGKLDAETPLEDLVAVFSASPALPRVLATCVRGEDGLPALDLAELDKFSLQTLTLASLHLCDIERIVESLSLREALEQAKSGAQPLDYGFDVAAYNLVSAARALGVAPLDLTAWPWEAFLTAQRALAVTEDQLKTLHATPLTASDTIPGLVFGGP